MKVKDIFKEHLTTSAKPITGTQAFGSAQLNILKDAGVSLIEKPSYWEEIDTPEPDTKYKPISAATFKKVESELKKSGYELKVYKGKEIFGSDKRPEGPLGDADLPKEGMFVVEFTNSKYLCDCTGARSYIRNWALIK